ncbi:translation elongation factor 4 [Malacoplasma iowae]|uniref:Elongation factor 4 n=1 Tax=Malacoplasma iowae 695 TaxID=1048830 RepID=A0A6P1LP58_MALIO|nr:translation elongation factor 4 [Malacoplasma iowae]VEU61964.1 GTP-binding protein lepA [Mycoplasmopsis fermentans]EGZ31131.1 GTP-binding protein LepA [Malacoplasma iowae 695]QHG90302.1 translation elongation factor 4 [Malacoplasma iowae 695]WPL36237.1 translation elongation factor 4 [Malacoplasma iowae]VEU70735.1 GTP-binding protein lepA [Malacoplasma iowae]
MDKKYIRNFSIIAHIDHGKSTISDRIIELTNGVSKREMKDQILDSMDIERERGITIKLNAVQLNYLAKDNQEYVFHLIDTPGHVDFTYEVSRSLAACEGALLIVDAAQGIEAQTLSNVYLALENNLEIIPVINKIDLPTANIEKVKNEIEDVIGLDCSTAPLVSAKTGLNIIDILEAIVKLIPPPLDSDADKPLQALVFDSYYDAYRGAVCLVRIKNGTVKVGDTIQFMSNKENFVVTEVGVNTPKVKIKDELVAGEVGWIAASIKTIKSVNVGDTITNAKNPSNEPLPGYKKILPMVYCGLYPIDTAQYEPFKEALEKISLSDSSLTYEYETSQALGFGIRCGFLGLLHMDVIRERIEREFNISLVATTPSVVYKILMNDGSIVDIDSANKLPDKTHYKEIREPYAKVEIIVPETYLGNIMDLCQKSRGEYISLDNIDLTRRKVVYHIPLAEIMYSFFDRLKSVSKGYATLDYEILDYRKQDLVKVDILLNGNKVDALSSIMHRDFAADRSRKICLKLKDHIPKHQFEVPIQAAIGGKIIARETIKAMRKNVLAKCYGGDISRKKKLLEQQKEGKKKLKAIGSVSVPHDTFVKILSDD